MKRYDLIIVGGGMTGLTLLAAIQPSIDQGMSVALIDPAPTPSHSLIASPSFDDRATALSAQALNTFASLDLIGLETVVSHIKHIEVSDQGHMGYHKMSAENSGFSQFGAVISNRALGGLLWSRTKKIPIDWLFETQVSTIRPAADGHLLTLSNQENVKASMVMLCDGGRSRLTEQLGIETRSYPFNASARVAVVKTSQHHAGVAFERFTSKGPIALLPFGEYSALVWTVPDKHRNHLPQTNKEALPWLNLQFGQRLGNITKISEWTEYPLTERTASTLALHNLLVLGNSAATLHPVAGQGFNLAIRGLVRSANVVNERWSNQHTTPNFNELSLLAEDINKDQQLTVLFSRELIHSFGSSNPLIQLGRGIGLGSLDRHPSWSKTFALASMGLLSNTPAL